MSVAVGPSLLKQSNNPIMTFNLDSLGGVMVSVLASSELDCWLEPWSGQTKDYNTACPQVFSSGGTCTLYLHFWGYINIFGGAMYPLTLHLEVQRK